MIKQLFPYAGSSRRYAGVLAEMIRREEWDTYAEPFVGSGAVFFALQPGWAHLGEIEYHIWNLYTQVRDDVGEVIRILKTLPPLKGRFLELGDEIRDLTGPQAAAVWYYLIRLAFNGVVRKKKDKERGGWRPWFTWGTAHRTWEKKLPHYCNQLRIASQMLDRADIHMGDYSGVPRADMAFFDPPWYGGKEKQYGVLDDFDYERLSEHLAAYDGKWVLTINDTPEMRALFLPLSKWQAPVIQFYGIAPVTHGKTYKEELILTNFSPRMFGG